MTTRCYQRLSLRDVDLGFAGRRHPSDSVHRAIAALSPCDPLRVCPMGQLWELVDDNGTVVGRLARKFQPRADMYRAKATVQAIAHWNRESSEPQYQSGLRCDAWEVVVPELVFER